MDTIKNLIDMITSVFNLSASIIAIIAIRKTRK